MGGEIKHSLTSYEGPNHNHGIMLYSKTIINEDFDNIESRNHPKIPQANWGASNSYRIEFNNPYSILHSGEGKPHENMMPYFVISMWRRTS